MKITAVSEETVGSVRSRKEVAVENDFIAVRDVARYANLLLSVVDGSLDLNALDDAQNQAEIKAQP